MTNKCIICDSKGYIQISEDHTKAGAVNICEECGHIYNQNISSDIELQKFLDDEFMGDPGANSRKKKDKVEHLDQRQKKCTRSKRMT